MTNPSKCVKSHSLLSRLTLCVADIEFTNFPLNTVFSFLRTDSSFSMKNFLQCFGVAAQKRRFVTPFQTLIFISQQIMVRARLQSLFTMQKMYISRLSGFRKSKIFFRHGGHAFKLYAYFATRRTRKWNEHLLRK